VSAVLFAGPKGQGQVTLDREVELVVVANLEPGRRYAVSIDGPSCVLRLGPGAGGADLTATRGGFVRVNATQCGVK
jgi:hypothetical protein